MACITTTGSLYGWIRYTSGSSAPAALAHASYNMTLYAIASLTALFAQSQTG
jgi:membrane protease YdiL (CAAX protease family)